MSNEKHKPPITENHTISPNLKWVNHSKIRGTFTGSYLKQDKVIFSPRNVINLFIVYQLDMWLRVLKTDFTKKDCLFGAIKLTKNADSDKYS